jgi:hypothetical protein
MAALALTISLASAGCIVRPGYGYSGYGYGYGPRVYRSDVYYRDDRGSHQYRNGHRFDGDRRWDRSHDDDAHWRRD